MNRRGFIGGLAAFAAACTLDPDLAIWIPGQRTFSIPSDPSWDNYYAPVNPSLAEALAAQREVLRADLPQLMWTASALWGKIADSAPPYPVRPSRIPISWSQDARRAG